MSTLRNWLVLPVDLGRLFAGWRQYRRLGETPGRAYQSLIRLFCTTGGYSNDILSRLIALRNPPVALPLTRGLLGELTTGKLDTVVGDMRRDGYHVFEQRLAPHVCDRILEYCLTHESDMRAMDGESPRRNCRAVYERDHPRAARYDFDTPAILANPDIQDILGDVTLLTVAQSYLGCLPLLDVLGLWWHTSFSKEPQREAAQYYHFDMDRLKWMKFFIYLTDVTSDNGPHTFVKGSHRAGQVPARLLARGYSRLEDEEVKSCYSEDRFIELNAPRGTVIAEDTRGLHKGKHVAHGDRLIMSIQFSNSLFGATYGKAYFDQIEDPGLSEMVQRFPGIYVNYLRQDNLSGTQRT